MEGLGLAFIIYSSQQPGSIGSVSENRSINRGGHFYADRLC